ncbi:MAG: homoserine kinase [Alphaproteobacteria bacterium]|nr:homoserine kinase [Alphaproteobacteria bacterium]
MAVYTKVSFEEITEFLTAYNIGEAVSFTGIEEGVENTNYFLKTTKNTFILTLYEKRVNPVAIPFFIDLMEHLAKNGVPCPAPIYGKDGKALHELNGKPATITSFLKGTALKNIAPDNCAELGKALAEMHLAALSFNGNLKNSLSVVDWRPLFMSSIEHADNFQKGLKNEILNELDDLESKWVKNLPRGVIHADLFPDNVFFIDSKISGLIDFCFSCNDFLAYDVAVCLNAWCFEKDCSFNVTKAKKMLKAYNKVRKLEQAEIEALSLLAKGSAMRFLLTRLYDWINTPKNALVKPKNPAEYLKKMRFYNDFDSKELFL